MYDNKAKGRKTYMNSDKVKKSNGGLVKLLYIVSAVLFIVFAYMVVSNIMYINTYTASYGMNFSDMWKESVQYVVTGSMSYLVYALVLLAVAKILREVSSTNVSEINCEMKDAGERIQTVDQEDAEQNEEESLEAKEVVEPVSKPNKNRKQRRKRAKRGYYR